MRNVWRGGIVIVALAAALLMLFVHRNTRRQPLTAATSAPDVPPLSLATNYQGHSDSKVFRSRRKELSGAQLADLKLTFETKLKPAVEHWCKAYAGHVPFKPENLTTDNFFEQIGRGKTCMYTFVLDGMTLAVADSNGSARFFYLNTPESSKLM